MHKFLDQRNCPQDHAHQAIAGNSQQAGESIRLSRFCATYSRGFATAVARVLHETPCSQLAYAAGGEPPNKRVRLNPGAFKRVKRSEEHVEDMLSTDPSDASSRILPDDSAWHEIFRLAQNSAARVGNTKCDVGSEIGEAIQQLLKEDLQVVCVFTCRGTDRLQIPINAPISQHVPWRRTCPFTVFLASCTM